MGQNEQQKQDRWYCQKKLHMPSPDVGEQVRERTSTCTNSSGSLLCCLLFVNTAFGIELMSLPSSYDGKSCNFLQGFKKLLFNHLNFIKKFKF
jgi:hypothetical protein